MSPLRRQVSREYQSGCRPVQRSHLLLADLASHDGARLAAERERPRIRAKEGLESERARCMCREQSRGEEVGHR
jgi:hypothetical protein